MKRIVVVGGGPAGMMAAIAAKMHHQAEVIILEKNNTLGNKLLLTGGGRCNITANVSNSEVLNNILSNPKFLHSSLNAFGPQEIMKYFDSIGLKLMTQKDHKVFPVSNKAIDVVKALINQLNILGVKIIFKADVKDIDYHKQVIYYNADNKLTYDQVIITTGGITYPITGSAGAGFQLAQNAGHTINDLSLSAVPLVSNDLVIQSKALQGLAVNDVTISIKYQKKVIQVEGDILFTHFGVSGPAILKISYFVAKLLQTEKTVSISINFLPHIKLLEKTHLKELPQRLVSYFQKEGLTLKDYQDFVITVYATRGINQAFVTAGGVCTSEINPKTMQSKKVKGLSFAGEVIDVCGHTGGYNLTLCFATGYSAGKYALED